MRVLGLLFLVSILFQGQASQILSISQRCTEAKDIHCLILSSALPLHCPRGKVVMTFWR